MDLAGLAQIGRAESGCEMTTRIKGNIVGVVSHTQGCGVHKQ